MKRLSLAIMTIVFLGALTAAANAQYASPNYKSEEVFFGTGGEVESTSPSYKAQSAAGALGAGKVTSPSFQAYSGFLTPNEPFLEMGVTTPNVDLGTLDTTTAKTGNASFYVRSYLDGTYSVQSLGQPLTMTSGSSYTLTALASQTASSAGTEQFGINLIANTSPATFGADPSPQPDGTFAFGQAASGYDTANQFKYVSGDIIAQSATSGWGQTNFTISYMANISVLTPAGSYRMVHDLIAVPTF